jgi:transcriptional regulator with XRE-family HTH domain
MLGEALRLIRVYHDLKQNQAATKLGLSTSYLSELEGGSKTPTLDVIQKYSKEFDLPVSSIMFFAENVESGKAPERARTMVAGKILKLMQFLEARAHVDAQ